MKKISIYKLCVILCVLSFVGCFSGYISTERKKEKKIPLQAILLPNTPLPELTAEDISLANSVTVKYVLKEHKGGLGIFSVCSDGKEELYEVYDILASALPKADREHLASGIESSSLSEILQIVEDYIA